MIDLIKKKEIKGILVSVLLIALSIFLILKPEEIISSLLRVMGILVLVFGLIDSASYFAKQDDTKLFDYGLLKGLMEVTLGILLIFKYEALISIFPMVLGLLIVFINVFKLQLALNLKEVEDSYLTGVIISALAVILGVLIIFNPFESLKVVVIVSGAVMLLSELANIAYSIIVLRHIRKTHKVVKDLVEVN